MAAVPEIVPQKSGESLFSTFSRIILIPFDKSLLQIAPEIGHLAPIIFIFGTGFLSLLTLNLPLAVFAASSVEAMFVKNFLNFLGAFAQTPSMLQAAQTGNQCVSSFQKLTPSRFNYFFNKNLDQNNFPNQSLFFISYAAAYVIQCMIYFNKETSELGPSYSNRPYTGAIGAALFISLYTVYLLMFNCDSSILSLFLTILLGCITGMALSSQNYLLFGKSSVNLLFIPPLSVRKGMDYVCANVSS